MEIRSFQLDSEWNMIHYPERPIGFGILIIGDERNYVDEKTSFWIENEGKYSLIQKLKEEGYTVFYSNLYRKNWGSRKAVQLAKRLYEFIIRTEIINDKIHLLAEGMGALVALQLMGEMGENIRSAVLINPVLSLKDHLEQEKEHKFFYKKLIKELCASYGVEDNQVTKLVNEQETSFPSNIPTKIIHILGGNDSYRESKRLNQLSVKWKNDAVPVSITYVVPDKMMEMRREIIRFYRSNEKVL